MIQTARGAVSWLTSSSREPTPVAPSPASFDGVRVEIKRDDLVSVLHQAARHVGAHAAEADHSELHRDRW